MTRDLVGFDMRWHITPQQMRHVGGDAVHLALVAVQGEREESGLRVCARAPEPLANEFSQRRGLLVQGGRLAIVTEMAQHGGQLPSGTVGVALHLDHGDRAIGQAPVGELDRVLRVLPALVAERASTRGLILQQPVAVGIAGTAHPVECGTGSR